MEISKAELDRLNFYRASELDGGILLSQLARRVRDPDLMLRLIRHGAEEVVHAQLWTETILAVGGAPSPLRDTYQRRYARAIGAPTSITQVLVLTQVFERRVYRHFLRHERLPGVHPVVRKTLRRMVEEEKDHLSWVYDWLYGQDVARREMAERLIREYTAVDELIYRELEMEYGFQRAA